MIRYAIAAIFAMAALTGLTVDTWSNVAAMGGSLDVRVYVATIAILGAVAGFFIPVAFKYNKLAGVVLLAGWALGVVFSIGASIDRVGGAKDAKVHAGASVNARIARLDQRIRDLTAKRNEEAGKGGCGRICRQWQQKLDAAISQRNGFGEVKETDPGSARIEAITAGMVKADRWRTLHPIFGVLALTCMFNAMSIVAGSIAVSARPAPKVINAQATEVVSPVVAALEQGAASNRELARRLKWPEDKTSREVKKLRALNVVTSKQSGRCKLISLI